MFQSTINNLPADVAIFSAAVGDYKVKNDRMSILHKKTHELLSNLKSWKIIHILRDKNVEADELSKEGLSK